jgi:flagellar assembly factor FliW
MQELNTSRFGVISYNPENAIIFPKGIIQLEGYEDCTSYHLFHEEDGNRVLHYLQSLDDPELSFTLVDPTFLNIDYDLELSDEETELMKVQGNGEDELVIMLMVYRPVVIEGAEVKTSEDQGTDSVPIDHQHQQARWYTESWSPWSFGVYQSPR